MVFRDLTEKEVEKLLPEIDSYNKNLYYSRMNFKKNFGCGCKYIGCFDETRCVALMSISEDSPNKGLVYFRELASFIPGHEYGIALLKHALKKYKNAWLLSNPVSGEKLAKNYRKIPELTEYVIPKSGFENLDLHFFHTITDKEKETQLIEFLHGVWKSEN